MRSMHSSRQAWRSRSFLTEPMLLPHHESGGAFSLLSHEAGGPDQVWGAGMLSLAMSLAPGERGAAAASMREHLWDEEHALEHALELLQEMQEMRVREEGTREAGGAAVSEGSGPRPSSLRPSGPGRLRPAVQLRLYNAAVDAAMPLLPLDRRPRGNAALGTETDQNRMLAAQHEVQRVLVRACNLGDLAAATLLLERGAAVDRATQTGVTPLYAACVHGQEAITTLLLERGAAINRTTATGATPLYAACRHAQEGIARLLLQHGATAKTATQDGGTPLYAACQHGQLKLAQLLLQHGAAVDHATHDGFTPLYATCVHGEIKLARLLLRHGADVDPTTQDGFICKHTPLYIACRHGQAKIARLLVQNGADVDRLTQEGFTPLYAACVHGQDELVRLLLKHGACIDLLTQDGFTPLFAACVHGHEALAKLLLERGAGVDRATQNGFTPLYVACMHGQADIVHLLARNGARPWSLASHKCASAGFTPVRVARTRGHHALADWLDAVRNFTPLHWACESRDPARVLAALRGDTIRDVDIRCVTDKDGMQELTPLELTSCPEAFPHAPSPVCAATAALMRATLAPWSPRTHHVQTAAFRRGVLAVLCVGVRLRGEAGRRSSRRRRRHGRDTATPVLLLPPEVWVCVLSHCTRGWWTAGEGG